MEKNIPGYCSVFVSFILRVYYIFCKSQIYLIFHIILHHDLFDVGISSKPKMSVAFVSVSLNEYRKKKNVTKLPEKHNVVVRRATKNIAHSHRFC